MRLPAYTLGDDFEDPFGDMEGGHSPARLAHYHQDVSGRPNQASVGVLFGLGTAKVVAISRLQESVAPPEIELAPIRAPAASQILQGQPVAVAAKDLI